MLEPKGDTSAFCEDWPCFLTGLSGAPVVHDRFPPHVPPPHTHTQWVLLCLSVNPAGQDSGAHTAPVGLTASGLPCCGKTVAGHPLVRPRSTAQGCSCPHVRFTVVAVQGSGFFCACPWLPKHAEEIPSLALTPALHFGACEISHPSFYIWFDSLIYFWPPFKPWRGSHGIPQLGVMLTYALHSAPVCWSMYMPFPQNGIGKAVSFYSGGSLWCFQSSRCKDKVNPLVIDTLIHQSTREVRADITMPMPWEQVGGEWQAWRQRSRSVLMSLFEAEVSMCHQHKMTTSTNHKTSPFTHINCSLTFLDMLMK